jgi:virulence factor
MKIRNRRYCMNIGMIGIGDIAEKAYLPVITKMKGLNITLCSRNENHLKDICETYPGLSYRTEIGQLLDHPVDAAFIHAATPAHYDICRELLKKRIPVYVDKPVSYHIEEIRRLFNLAKENNCILRVGFNRREAPLIKELKSLEKPDIVICQKNRVNLPSDPRIFIFDDFIHVVDTLRYLLDDDILSVNVKGKLEGGMLYFIMVQLIGKRGTAVGIMDRDSGRNEERLEYLCPGEKRIIEDLNTLTIYKGGIETHRKFGDWEPVLYRRGFHRVIEQFISDVKAGNGFMDRDEDSLKTHELCEMIVRKLTEAGPV